MFSKINNELSKNKLLFKSLALFFVMFLSIITTPLTLAIDATWQDASTLKIENTTYTKTPLESFPADVRSEYANYSAYTYKTQDGQYTHAIFVANDEVGKAGAESTRLSFTNGDNGDLTLRQDARDTVNLTGSADTTENTESSNIECQIPDLGWIICPVVRTTSAVLDGLYSIIANYLTVETVYFDSSENGGNNSIHRVWSFMAGAANIGFVIAFLVIIYSQITNTGLSSYGIKALLPRLIVIAVIANISYWLTAAAIDMSNLLGTGLKTFFDGLTESLQKQVFTDQSTFFNGGATNSTETSVPLVGSTDMGLMGSIAAVALVGIGGAFLFAKLGALLPLLVSGLIILFAVFIALIVRQGLIIALLVVAPLAIVANILPATREYFDKWLSMLKGLLIMFPVIAVLFGVAKLVSVVILGTINGINDETFFTAVLAAGVLFAPFILVPGMIKNANEVMSKIANSGALGGITKKGYDMAESRGKRFDNQTKATRQNRAAQLIENSQSKDGDSRATRARKKLKRGIARGMNAPFSSEMTQLRDQEAETTARIAAERYLDVRVDNDDGLVNNLARGGGISARARIKASVANKYFENLEKAAKDIKGNIGTRTPKQLEEMYRDTSISVEERLAAIMKITEKGGLEEAQNLANYLIKERHDGDKTIGTLGQMFGGKFIENEYRATLGWQTREDLRAGKLGSENLTTIQELTHGRFSSDAFDAKKIVEMPPSAQAAIMSEMIKNVPEHPSEEKRVRVQRALEGMVDIHAANLQRNGVAPPTVLMNQLEEMRKWSGSNMGQIDKEMLQNHKNGSYSAENNNTSTPQVQTLSVSQSNAQPSQQAQTSPVSRVQNSTTINNSTTNVLNQSSTSQAKSYGTPLNNDVSTHQPSGPRPNPPTPPVSPPSNNP